MICGRGSTGLPHRTNWSNGSEIAASGRRALRNDSPPAESTATNSVWIGAPFNGTSIRCSAAKTTTPKLRNHTRTVHTIRFRMQGRLPRIPHPASSILTRPRIIVEKSARCYPAFVEQYTPWPCRTPHRSDQPKIRPAAVWPTADLVSTDTIGSSARHPHAILPARHSNAHSKCNCPAKAGSAADGIDRGTQARERFPALRKSQRYTCATTPAADRGNALSPGDVM